ncbi:MAG TPA: mechanosensitive ion channel family protein [Defluviitoga sp.]|nr:mechanosensitive ion channel family protein [Defluviitoga sp.]HOP24820.1 mechanosensitive ion channel family protein [Defluviitoga sp.]HPZ28270.1 mechanosensitive ion channel family protein [Defluviitoga sp.]HQD62160.1 mechanosensitive ion channel family protein [Defluviitoga sp.]
MEEWVKTTLIYLIKIGISVLIIVLAKYLAKLIYKIILSTAEKRGKVAITYKRSLMTMINIAMYTLAAFIIISVIFTNLSAFLAGLGIGGVIIAFAVQEPLGNLICGFLIMLNHLVVDGEAVEIDGIGGTVQEIDVNHVILKTFDGKLIHFPSKEVWTNKIIHYWPEDIRRNEIKVRVSYLHDINLIAKVLNEAVNSSELVYIDDSHKPAVVFDSYGDSSMNFVVRFWVKRENFINSSLNVAEKIKQKFLEYNLEIPYNQIDLHVKDVNPKLLQHKERD